MIRISKRSGIACGESNSSTGPPLIAFRNLIGPSSPFEIPVRVLRGQQWPCEIFIQDLEGQPLPSEILERPIGGRLPPFDGTRWVFGGPSPPSEIRDPRINGRCARIRGHLARSGGARRARRGPAQRSPGSPGLSSNPRRRDKNRTGAPGRTACTSAPPVAGRNWGRCASPRRARRCGGERRRAGDRGAVAWRQGRRTRQNRQGLSEPT